MKFDLDLPILAILSKARTQKSLTRANPFLCTHSSQSPYVLLKAIVGGSKLFPGGTICPSHSIGIHDSWADASAFIVWQSLLFKSGRNP